MKKNIFILCIVIFSASCAPSPKPYNHPVYLIDLSSLKISATHTSEILTINLTNTSSQTLAVDKPWFGPCSSIVVTPVGSDNILNPMGSATLGAPQKLEAGSESVFQMRVKGLESDKQYNIVYTPYPLLWLDKNKVKCVSKVKP